MDSIIASVLDNFGRMRACPPRARRTANSGDEPGFAGIRLYDTFKLGAARRAVLSHQAVPHRMLGVVRRKVHGAFSSVEVAVLFPPSRPRRGNGSPQEAGLTEPRSWLAVPAGPLPSIGQIDTLLSHHWMDLLRDIRLLC